MGGDIEPCACPLDIKMNILGPTSSFFIPKPYKGPNNHPCHSKYYNNNNMTHVGQLFTLRGTIIHSTRKLNQSRIGGLSLVLRDIL